MNNILVATDFSNQAYSAFFYATQLLASKPCTFYVLHVFDQFTPLEGKSTPLLGSKKLLKPLHRASMEKLTRTVHKIVMDNGNPHHRYQTLSIQGTLVKVMSEVIDEYSMDLVVVGSKGKTGSKEIFLGSNTIQMANSLNTCPILAVPKEIDFKIPKEIAFVTDLKKGCGPETIMPLLFLIRLFNSSLRVMHITEEDILNKEQETNRKLLENCLKDVDHSFHWVQEFSDKAMIINYFLKKINLDLVAMVHQKHSFLEQLIREPVIKDVSMYTDIPLLILPHGA